MTMTYAGHSSNFAYSQRSWRTFIDKKDNISNN